MSAQQFMEILFGRLPEFFIGEWAILLEFRRRLFLIAEVMVVTVPPRRVGPHVRRWGRS
jgi:hypothetical protein